MSLSAGTPARADPDALHRVLTAAESEWFIAGFTARPRRGCALLAATEQPPTRYRIGELATPPYRGIRLEKDKYLYCRKRIYFIANDLPSTSTTVVDDAMHHGDSRDGMAHQKGEDQGNGR